jgi:hypothetical protein
MPQMFQQALWIRGTYKEGQGQEVVWQRRELKGPSSEGLGLLRLYHFSGDAPKMKKPRRGSRSEAGKT